MPRGGFASIPANWFPVLLTCEFESSFLVLSFGLDVFVNTVIFTVVDFGCCCYLVFCNCCCHLTSLSFFVDRIEPNAL